MEPMSMEEVKKHYNFALLQMVLQTAPKCSKLLQNGSKCSKELQTTFKQGSKMLHFAPKSLNLGSKMLQNAPFSAEPEVCSVIQCEFCLKMYSKNSNLTKHLKNVKKKMVESVWIRLRN